MGKGLSVKSSALVNKAERKRKRREEAAKAAVSDQAPAAGSVVSEVAAWAEQRAAKRAPQRRDAGRFYNHPLSRLYVAGTIDDAEFSAGIEIALWLEAESMPGGHGALGAVDPSRIVVDGGGPVSTALRTVRIAGVSGDVQGWRKWANCREARPGHGAGDAALVVCGGKAVGEVERLLGMRTGTLGGVVAWALRGYATQAYRDRRKPA
jgi:hypothetical protein